MNSSNESDLKRTIDIFKLIQPELLSVEELVGILQERSVNHDLLSMSKEKLVQLFKKVALPLPQRELRQNYRESLLLKLRKKTERIKIGDSFSKDHKSYSIGVTGSSMLTKLSETEKSSGDRLKPPPDLVNYERKKIRLTTTNSSVGLCKRKIASDLDTVVIKTRKISDSVDSITSNKNIKSNSKCVQNSESQLNPLLIEKHRNGSENNTTSSTNEFNSPKRDSLPKKVSLKRSHLFSKALNMVTSENSADKTISEPDSIGYSITDDISSILFLIKNCSINY